MQDPYNTPNPQQPPMQQQVIVAKKESGTVTALTVLALILGTIGLLGSFIPCLGALAIYLAIPALILGGVAFYLAKNKDISIGLPVTAVVIAGLATIISAFQIMALNSAADELNKVNKEFQDEINKARIENIQTGEDSQPSQDNGSNGNIGE